VRVYRRPRVAILSTGNELADLGTEPQPGQIPNTNTYSLMAQVLECGATVMNLGVAPDAAAAIEARVRQAHDADVLVSSAGVSVGELDFVKAALESAGARLHLWRVSMRPGKPITFGSLHGRPVFGLPGNPVSAMVTFELFVRPAMRKLLGHRRLFRRPVIVELEEAVTIGAKLTHFLRAIVTAHPDGSLTARLTGPQGSGILTSMSRANALLIVPEERARVEAGEELHALLLVEDTLWLDSPSALPGGV